MNPFSPDEAPALKWGFKVKFELVKLVLKTAHLRFDPNGRLFLFIGQT